MTKCCICKSKMPEELFVPAFPRVAKGNVCPICTMTLRNKYIGLALDTLPQGEIAASLVDDAWQYYKPKGENIYNL